MVAWCEWSPRASRRRIPGLLVILMATEVRPSAAVELTLLSKERPLAAEMKAWVEENLTRLPPDQRALVMDVLSRHTSALGTELALPSAIARRRGPAHGASRPPHRAGRTQHTPSTAAQTPPQFNPQRHAGVTTWSASRSASRSAGRRTFRCRSPTRGRGQGRGGADDGGCPSAAARGGSGSHRVDEEDEPAPKRKKVM